MKSNDTFMEGPTQQIISAELQAKEE